MLQDIIPHKFDISYKANKPQIGDYLLIFSGEKLLIYEENGNIEFPTVGEINVKSGDVQYLFQIDNKAYFMVENNDCETEKWKYCVAEKFRKFEPMWKSFAAITSMQLHRWYNKNKFCGCCGNKLKKSCKERALICYKCNNIVFPSIAPSVIVAVTNGNKILLTKYAVNHSNYRKYALVAGYVEIGETLEETVKREVMEEVGLKVKNIRYYKSQPWSLSDSLLMGFFCELDGDEKITLEREELSTAEWFERENIPYNSSTISLTNEMIEYFRKSK